MLNWFVNIFNKIKCKQSLNRVIELSSKYRNFISKDCLIKISDNLYWFVNRDHSITSICMKKPNWRLYVGCYRVWIMDEEGNEFKQDLYFSYNESTEKLSLENIFPDGLIDEYHAELVRNEFLIKEFIDYELRNKFYKQV